MEKLNLNIRMRRLELGLSQDELAERLGYADRSSIAKIETGVVDISIKQLKKIAVALETTPYDLIKYLWEEES